MAGWFLGVEVPTAVRRNGFHYMSKAIRAAGTDPMTGPNGIQWTDPDGWHSTLEWFGTRLNFYSSAPELVAAAERARVKRPFVLQMHTPYVFHVPGNPTAYLCADLRGDLDQWYLHSVSTAPHVTLAKMDAVRYFNNPRYADQVDALVSALRGWKSEWWMVDRVSLFESAGGDYTVHDKYMLGGV